MTNVFPEWVSIVSLIINVLLIMASVALTVLNWKASRKSKSQVKIWMEQANGITTALQRIVTDKWNGLYTSVNDIANSVWAVHSSAFSLYQSLYEERVLTEKEYKKEQMEQRAYIRKESRKSSSQKKVQK